MIEGAGSSQMLVSTVISLQLIRMSDNLDRNIENEKFCSQLSTYFNRHGIDVVINFRDSSTNQKLQVYYEHLRNVRKVLIKEQQQRSIQTTLDSFFKPALIHSKTSTTSESSINE
jgi:arginine deiminase